MAKNNINEDLVKQIMAGGGIVPAADDADPAGVSEPQSEKKTPVKKKKNNSASYADLFLQRAEIKDRQMVYVNRETHERLSKIATVIGGKKVTISSLVESIILHHFDEYQEEINQLYEQSFSKPF